MSRHQQEVISYLIEENRVLREQMGNRRLKFNDDQRRRLAAKAKKLGRKMLGQVATLAAPETLLTWHRKLIAENYAGYPVSNSRSATNAQGNCCFGCPHG